MNIAKIIKLKPDEKIVLVLRASGITKLTSFVLAFLILSLAFFIMFWSFQHGWWGQLIFGLLIFLAVYIFLKVWFFWTRNLLIITNYRVVDKEQSSFFRSVISIISYDQLEDVHGEISGFFGTILRYGDLVLLSGKGNLEIVAKNIKRPVKIQELINELQDVYLSGRLKK